MSKQIMQIRYYGEKGKNDTTTKNYPTDLAFRMLTAGSVFNNLYPITQLGIQTLPGTKFYLNNGQTPIIVGSTGIYELDLEGLSEITELRFDPGSINRIDSNPNAYLIVDLVCGV